LAKAIAKLFRTHGLKAVAIQTLDFAFLFAGNKQGLFRQDNHGTSIPTAFRPWTKAANNGL